ncbi:hypothetical protein AB0I60_33575 [Actinosynnema sp. NPDC050436]|uniref:hypothetical protein n=1 Tax=Actinosynnema sp. NPDC050436 TaxID=3155659 RepID=UPI0033D37C38
MARLRFLAHAAATATVAAGLLTAVLTGTASACSCYPGDNEVWRYNRADHVFVGLVTAKRRDPRDPASGTDDQYVYTVWVSQEYKGDVPRRVDVATHVQGSACGLGLTVGTKYLVFAKGDSSDRRVESHQCDGTRLASGGPPVTTGLPTSTTLPPLAACAKSTSGTASI